MKALLSHAPGGPETLRVVDLPDPVPSAGELLVRVRAGPYVGWGECEAAPLVSIASLVAPMSHSACKPIIDSVLGQPINDRGEVERSDAHPVGQGAAVDVDAGTREDLALAI